MAIDDQSRYQELGEAWRQVVAWREKLFAGYLTVLGALGYVVLQNSDELRRSVLCIAGILLSVMFQLLEIRTRNIANEYQYTGSLLEKPGSGCYTTMENARDQSTRWLTFGFPISLLTGFAIGICVVGLMRYLPPTLPKLLAPISIETSLLMGAITGFLVVVFFESLGGLQSRRDKRRRREEKREDVKILSEKEDHAA